LNDSGRLILFLPGTGYLSSGYCIRPDLHFTTQPSKAIASCTEFVGISIDFLSGVKSTAGSPAFIAAPCSLESAYFGKFASLPKERALGAPLKHVSRKRHSTLLVRCLSISPTIESLRRTSLVCKWRQVGEFKVPNDYVISKLAVEASRRREIIFLQF
jgi:hypothetical protein